MLSIANDYLGFDGLQPVTYSVKLADGNSYAAPVVIKNCIWRKLSQVDYMKNPRLLMQVARPLNIWTAECQGIIPKLGDKLVGADNTTWIVAQAVEKLDQDDSGVPTRYRLVCLQSTQVA